MRTTLTIQDSLFQELMRATGARSRNQAVVQAIQGWLDGRRWEQVKQARGKFHFDQDWKELRQLEVRDAEPAHAKRRR